MVTGYRGRCRRCGMACFEDVLGKVFSVSARFTYYTCGPLRRAHNPKES